MDLVGKNDNEELYIDADKMSVHKDNEKQVKVIAGKFEKAEGPVKGHNVEPVYFDVELYFILLIFGVI